MTEITHRQIKTNGINLHIAEAGKGPLVLMLHGFPELWYSYRHQLPALAAAGYHAVAPDIRGYGDSDRPHELEAYSMRHLTADAVGILDALGEKDAVIVGHDWGAPMAWNSAVLYPDRFRAVIALSVPYLPRGPVAPTTMFKALFQDKFFYMLYFQDEGVAEEEFEADIRTSMLKFMYFASGEAPEGLAQTSKPAGSKLFEGVDFPEKMPAWLSKEDLDTYVTAFEKSGFRGPLNRYRCMDLDWGDLTELQDAKVQQPALFVAGEKDGVIAFAPMDPMKELVPNLTGPVMLPGCGHWTQQEFPQEVNAAILDFLAKL